MNWTDQMQQLLGTWSAAQRDIASQWTEALRRAPTPGQATADDWASRWRELAGKNFETYLGKAGGVQGSVAQRMLSGAQTYHRFVEFVAETLRNMMPQVAPGADWAEAVTRQVEALKGRMQEQPQLWMNPASAAAMAGDVSELWRLFGEQAKSVATPWFESVGQARGQLGEALGGDHQALLRMSNLFTDTFESTLGKLLGAPAIGYSREHQEKLTKTFDAWVENKKAEAVFNTELTAIGFRAVEALVAKLKEKGLANEKIESPRKLFDLWVEVAEKTYFEAASTESFAQTQADLLNAAMRFRLQEKALVEVFYKAVHLPTRQELDDAYKHMYELRTQVKKLTKTATALQDQVASLGESRQSALDASQATAKKLATLQAEVAALKEFRKDTLAASRAAARASERAAKAAAKKAPAARKPAAKTTAGDNQAATAKATSKPAGKRPAAKAPAAAETAPRKTTGTRAKSKEG